MNRMGLRLLAVPMTALILVACQHTGTSTMTSSTADPGVGAGPIAPAQIDGLALTFDEASREVPDLDNEYPPPVEQQPTDLARDPQAEQLGIGKPCFPVYNGIGDTNTVGADTVSFRKVRFNGASNAYLLQVIALYKDPASAQSSFNRQSEQLNACKAAAVDDVVAAPSSAETLSWHYQKQGSHDYVCAQNVRLVSNVVLQVKSCPLYQTGAAVDRVADTIAAKISTRN